MGTPRSFEMARCAFLSSSCLMMRTLVAGFNSFAAAMIHCVVMLTARPRDDDEMLTAWPCDDDERVRSTEGCLKTKLL